ncbi:MAG TPA: hypothetical protein VGB85_19250 [Nannocystis sp.]
MSHAHALSALAGLVVVAAALGGMMSWQSSTDTEARAAAEARGEWRPPCAQRLGSAYAAIDPVPKVNDSPPRTLLFGVDRSPSNLALADEQMDAVVAHAATLPAETGVGVLLISDRSERSSTPDMPFEAASPRRSFTPAPLPCAPDCTADSLFKKKCLEQIDEAQARRITTLDLGESQARQTAQEQRAERIHRWREQVRSWTPKPGTSLLGFWAKVADLPVIRRTPERTTVVVFSDLEEARTPDRKKVEQFYKQYQARGACPEAAWLPQGIGGLDIVLVQTVSDGIDATAWGERWEAVLTCAGAHVRRHRYSPAISVAEVLGPDEPARVATVD